MKIRLFPKRNTSFAANLYIPGIESLFSDGSKDFIDPPAPHYIGQKVTISMRGIRGIGIENVKLRIFPDGEERLLPMIPEEKGPFTYWKAETTLNRSPFNYRFRIQTQRQVLWLNASGIHQIIPPDEEDFKLVPNFQEPAWARKSVFYQIFPDRFKAGKPEISLAPRKISPSLSKINLKKWDEPLSKKNEGIDFYGGDLWGILDKLDYLAELGINGLYLNPIFTAASNHRYDTINLREVDPYLGGNEALIALQEGLAKRGMRYVLDGVFNHVGYHHPWFQEALRDPKSPTCEFFSFLKHPDQYVSWLGHKSLPKLNYASKHLQEEIWLGKNAVAKIWLREPYSASGWRLDAPNMLGCDGVDNNNLELWRDFRRSIKSEFPEAYIFGECFFEGTKWLQGDAFDAVMNYKGFTIPILQWASGLDLHMHPAEITTQAAVQMMTSVMARIPFTIRNLQFNSLSTHDIPRFIHRVRGNENLYKLALTIQMAFPGVPCIYYGEEVALEGGEDPDNRRPMPWNRVEEKKELRNFVAKLAQLRKTIPAISEGAFAFLAAEEDTFAFTRFLENNVLVVAANRSPLPRKLKIPVSLLGFPDGESFRSVLTMESLKTVEGGYINLHLGPREAFWLVPA